MASAWDCTTNAADGSQMLLADDEGHQTREVNVAGKCEQYL
ncbi:MAG TPA: hypothetical protein VHX67_04945 [Acidimicrobiales bacterium]|nr:hypothetical protein [Acidimicrobiales bacterium]